MSNGPTAEEVRQTKCAYEHAGHLRVELILDCGRTDSPFLMFDPEDSMEANKETALELARATSRSRHGEDRMPDADDPRPDRWALEPVSGYTNRATLRFLG